MNALKRKIVLEMLVKLSKLMNVRSVIGNRKRGCVVEGSWILGMNHKGHACNYRLESVLIIKEIKIL